MSFKRALLGLSALVLVLLVGALPALADIPDPGGLRTPHVRVSPRPPTPAPSVSSSPSPGPVSPSPSPTVSRAGLVLADVPGPLSVSGRGLPVLVGAGVAVVVLVGGALWLLRRLRKKEEAPGGEGERREE